MVKKRIVCVDDEKPILEMLSGVLGRNYDVQVVACPQQALREFKPEETDLLITDFQLRSSLTGHDLIRKVQDKIGYKGPVLLLSSAPPHLNYMRQGLAVPLEYDYPFVQKGSFKVLKKAIENLLL